MTNKEELRKELTNLIDSEIARAKLPRGVNIKDGGRIMCQQIFINKLDKYIEQIRKEDMERVVEEIEERKRIKAQMVYKSYDEPLSNSGYLQGLDFALSIIKQSHE